MVGLLHGVQVSSTTTSVTISYRAGDNGGADIVGYIVELAGQDARVCSTTKAAAFPKDAPYVQVQREQLQGCLTFKTSRCVVSVFSVLNVFNATFSMVQPLECLDE